jgi:hypothetical protein
MQPLKRVFKVMAQWLGFLSGNVNRTLFVLGIDERRSRSNQIL